MTRDAIIEDVKAARQRIFEACNEDLDILLNRFREHEKLDQGQVVSDIWRLL